MFQIASRALNVPMSNIFIKDTCTGNVPNAAPSAASFGTDAVGMAIKVFLGKGPVIVANVLLLLLLMCKVIVVKKNRWELKFRH